MADFLRLGRRHQRAQHAEPVGRGSAQAASPIWRSPKSSAAWSASSRTARSTGISIEVEGAAAELNQKPITGAVLAGLMRVHSDTVNMVNAPFLAKERGLDVREVRHEREGDYHTLVRVTVEDRGGRALGRGHAVRRRRAAPGRAVRHQGRGRSRRPHALHRQRGRAGLHRPARHDAGRGGRQHRHLPPRPPRGGRRGGAAAVGRRAGDAGSARQGPRAAGREDGDGR